MKLPAALETLVESFMAYPGIGRKTAQRYALFTITNLSEEAVAEMSEALAEAKKEIHRCPRCGHLTDQDLCEVCADPERDMSTIMVVEKAKDVFVLESAGQYDGLYHVLDGVLSPMNGVGPSDLNLRDFWKRIEEPTVREVIIATSATQEGEATAMYLLKVLEKIDVLVTRIGYGVPVGSDLEYADEKTLSKAIENRKKF
jgi:recombination protein RecR